jgi:hypothetical protein
MRVLTLCATLLVATLAFAQRPVQVYGPGSGPYVPLVTTPQISLQQVSPNPVGASSATYGLMAGARNSTLSMVNGNTSSTYTEPVWYSGGGAPLISEREVSLYPRPIHGHPMMRREIRIERRERVERASRQWTYISSMGETTSAAEVASAIKGIKPATRTITNQDIDRENEQTGTVKYDGKTEKIQ